MESDGTHDSQSPSRDEFFEDIKDRVQKIGISLQMIKDSIQRGECSCEDWINEAREDIRNIMNDIQNYSFVHQIRLDHDDGFQIIKTNLQNMKVTLQEILNDIKETEQANKNIRSASFGEDWFRWEDWRVDKTFMDVFYQSISDMQKHHEEVRRREAVGASASGRNPIVEMLLSKKEDKDYGKLDIDKMIRFFTDIGVKYWYAVNTSKYSPDEAINSLKGNPHISNPEFISFLKRNPARED